jgi:hypothetical protein
LASVDPDVAAAAATRLKSLLPALTIDALQLAALDANILPASMRLLSSPASSVGDNCAACLGYLAACACKGLDASSATAALVPMIQALEQAVARDSSKAFSFFRPLISVMGSEAGSIRAGLSKVVHGVLCSAHDASVICQLVAAYNLLPVILHCLETADDVQCFPALLRIYAVILRAGRAQAATHGRNPYAVAASYCARALCRAALAKVAPHLRLQTQHLKPLAADSPMTLAPGATFCSLAFNPPPIHYPVTTRLAALRITLALSSSGSYDTLTIPTTASHVSSGVAPTQAHKSFE